MNRDKRPSYVALANSPRYEIAAVHRSSPAPQSYTAWSVCGAKIIAEVAKVTFCVGRDCRGSRQEKRRSETGEGGVAFPLKASTFDRRHRSSLSQPPPTNLIPPTWTVLWPWFGVIKRVRRRDVPKVWPTSLSLSLVAAVTFLRRQLRRRDAAPPLRNRSCPSGDAYAAGG